MGGLGVLEISPSISSLIQPGVITIESEATVSEAARIMTQNSVRNIFVMKKGEPIGLVRDWDIITRVVAFNSDPDMVRVDEIMYTPAPTVTTDAELSQIAALMAESGVRRVLVREGDKTLGTITAGRLLSIVSFFPKTPLRELYRKIQREV
jgi:CBS domain-containing protein